MVMVEIASRSPWPAGCQHSTMSPVLCCLSTPIYHTSKMLAEPLPMLADPLPWLWMFATSSPSLLSPHHHHHHHQPRTCYVSCHPPPLTSISSISCSLSAAGGAELDTAGAAALLPAAASLLGCCCSGLACVGHSKAWQITLVVRSQSCNASQGHYSVTELYSAG